ncbi:MAG: hypothetical protein ACREBU_12220 [Nitrososphaera sp.]
MSKATMSILNREEIASLTRMFLENRKSRDATENEIIVVLKWARQAKTIGTLFEMVMNGEVIIDVDDKGQAIFRIEKDKP